MSESRAQALGYLIGVSALNRARVKLKRLREPRYVAALVLGLAYIWYFLIRPIPGMDAHVGARPSTESLLGTTGEMVATLGIALLAISSWLSSSARLSLAYTPAEIHFLFPGPLTRRALLAYKISRLQIAVIINALLWVFILRRGGSTLSPGLRALSVWTVFTTIYLHRLAASLTRVSWAEHGRAGLRRQRLTLVLLGVVATTIAWSLLPIIRGSTGGDGPRDLFRAIVAALSTAPASWVLAPVHWLLGPTFAATTSEWVVAFPFALGVLLVHLLWVFRADVAFEDAAIKASEDRVALIQARQQRRGQARATGKGGKRRGGARTLPLTPTGAPAVALVWKNALALVRATQVQGLIVVAVTAFPIALVMSNEGEGNLRTFVGLMCVFGAAALVLLGGRAVRNDLRLDLPQIEILKTLPLSGRSIVAAEVASSTISLTLIQLALLVIAFLALLGNEALPLSTGDRFVALVAAAPVFLLLNGVTLSIQNGIAVLFPAWTRLGPGTGGIEVLGQGVLALLGSVVMTALVLLPAIALVAFGWPAARMAGSGGLLLLALGGLGLLAAELAGIIVWLGRAFDRMEPAQVTAP